MKSFRFTTLSGVTTTIDLDTRTYDALAHESTRGWGETLDWHEAQYSNPYDTRLLTTYERCRWMTLPHARYRITHC